MCEDKAMNTQDHQRRAAEIQAEETRLSFTKFDFADAWAIGYWSAMLGHLGGGLQTVFAARR